MNINCLGDFQLILTLSSLGFLLKSLCASYTSSIPCGRLPYRKNHSLDLMFAKFETVYQNGETFKPTTTYFQQMLIAYTHLAPTGVRTCDLQFSSQALYHWAIQPIALWIKIILKSFAKQLHVLYQLISYLRLPAMTMHSLTQVSVFLSL